MNNELSNGDSALAPRWEGTAVCKKCSCKTEKVAFAVTAERNSLSPVCHNMLSIVSLYKKRPMEILESFPLFLKERGLSYGSGNARK